MREYATKEATIEALLSLGFTKLKHIDNSFVSSGKDSAGFTIAKAVVYLCRNDYYCVDVNGGWQAPIVWNGPKAEWDTTDTTAEFVNWLDEHFAGWR